MLVDVGNGPSNKLWTVVELSTERKTNKTEKNKMENEQDGKEVFFCSAAFVLSRDSVSCYTGGRHDWKHTTPRLVSFTNFSNPKKKNDGCAMAITMAISITITIATMMRCGAMRCPTFDRLDWVTRAANRRQWSSESWTAYYLDINSIENQGETKRDASSWWRWMNI